jgi:hypothetical protein
VKKSTKKLVIKTFEAAGDMASSLTFAEGYVGVLVGQGLNNSYVGKLEWISTPGVMGVVAEIEEEEIVGGLLLFLPQEDERLPLEEIVGSDKMGFWFREGFNRKDVGELFAVWNSKKMAGLGLSYVLLKAGVALGAKLGRQRIYFLVSEYNLRLAQRIGMHVVKREGMDVHFVFDHIQPVIRTYLCEYDYTENSNDLLDGLKEKGAMVIIEKVLGLELEVDYRIF